MRNFIKKMIMMIMALAAFFLPATPSMAQKSSKISPATRFVIKDRDGGLSLETPQGLVRKGTTTFTPDGQVI